MIFLKRFLFIGLLLPLWLFLKKEVSPKIRPLAPWESKNCDTTYRANSLKIYDLVIPFRLVDSLRTKPANRVYVVIKSGSQFEWACVTANAGERPWQITKMQDAPTNWAMKTLTWQETEYLWALADRPTYLYDRWEKLLASTRQEFVVKRDDLASVFPELHPGYSMKVYADLRKANTQTGLLKAGKSAAPLSHHQFGLASDVNIFKNGKRSQSFETYKKLDESNNGLTWGGNFKGFVDPNHIQYFQNSAKMLEAFPELRFEFEPFRSYYTNRVYKFIAAGKEDKAQDTQDLLTTLNNLRQNEPCTCQQAKFGQNSSVKTIENQVQTIGYQANNDILLIGNIDLQTMSLQLPAQTTISERIGRWK